MTVAIIRPDMYPDQNHNGGPTIAEKREMKRGNLGSLEPQSNCDRTNGDRTLPNNPWALTLYCTTLEYSESMGRHRRLTVQTKNASHAQASSSNGSRRFTLTREPEEEGNECHLAYSCPILWGAGDQLRVTIPSDGSRPNDEVERRGASPTTNEADLCRSPTSLLGPPKTRPAIAQTDCRRLP